MKKTLLLLAALSWAGFPSSNDAAESKPDSRFYEMRIYYAPDGKLEDLNARFRNHTLKLFEKHGIQNIGYWVPLENPENKLVYILGYPSREAREASWKAFFADADWQKAWKESELNGKLVEKVESIYLKATDYSPEIKASVGSEPRVFELRTYKTPPGKLDHLHARFRDHTVGLFSKHGIVNVGYWTTVDQDKGADDTLIYIVSHKSKEAAAASFRNFGADPKWTEARKASEEKAGGSLTVRGGVKSEFLKATDYSPTK